MLSSKSQFQVVIGSLAKAVEPSRKESVEFTHALATLKLAVGV